MPDPSFRPLGLPTTMTDALPFQVLPHGAPIKATIQRLLLSPGIHALTVVEGSRQPDMVDGLPVPSVHVAVPPGALAGAPAGVEIIGTLPDAWLTKRGDSLVIKVAGETASLLLTSYKFEDRPEAGLGIRMLQLDGDAALAPLPASPQAVAEPAPPPVRAEILVHVQKRGDVLSVEGAWAGCVGEGLWIEAFGIALSGELDNESIEYRALLASGWETPWVPGGQLCGSRGMGVAIVGFAIRLAGAAAARYDCVYEGLFLSGTRAGPRQGGTACQSDAANDPLEAVLFQLVEKPQGADRLGSNGLFRRS